MTETDYEHECMRAELLGIEKPSREEFFSRKIENVERENDDMENLSTEVTEELDHQGEGMNRASGGLDELNNILSVTQKKINHLKTVCGSFTKILKLHTLANKDAGSGNEETSSTTVEITDNSAPQDETDAQQNEGDKGSATATPSRKAPSGDLQSAVDSQLSKLDSLISKAEKADLSLSSQNKQMKKFLK